MQRNIRTLTHDDINKRARIMCQKIGVHVPGTTKQIYPIPRGGVPAAYSVIAWLRYNRVSCIMVDHPAEANVFIDDVIDSGATRDRFAKDYPGKPFYALFDKLQNKKDREWLVFPWEHSEKQSTEDIGRRLIQFIGEDVTRDGLRETPERFARAWKEWTEGYDREPADLMKTFEDAMYDEMVLVRGIPFYSHCEHHLAPFFGTVDIGYIPGVGSRVVGLSKLGRLVDVFAKRLQIQERMTRQISRVIRDQLAPKGVGVLVKARHLCMESRGLSKQGHETVTSSLSGVFRTHPETRSEFMELVK